MDLARNRVAQTRTVTIESFQSRLTMGELVEGNVSMASRRVFLAAAPASVAIASMTAAVPGQATAVPAASPINDDLESRAVAAGTAAPPVRPRGPAIAVEPTSSLAVDGRQGELVLSLANFGTQQAWIDEVTIGSSTLSFATATRCEDSAGRQYPYQVTNSEYGELQKAFLVKPGQSATLTVRHLPHPVPNPNEAGVTASAHLQFTTFAPVRAAIPVTGVTMAKTVPQSMASTIMSMFTKFDGYLDTLVTPDGWMLNHPVRSGPASDAYGLGYIYKMYQAAYDITGTEAYLDKAKAAVEQLLRTQKPNGGWVQPWVACFGATCYGAGETHGVMTAFAVHGLAEAAERLNDPRIVKSLRRAADFFLRDPDQPFHWLDQHKGSTLTYPAKIQIDVNGLTMPWSEIYNEEASVVRALGLIQKVTKDGSISRYSRAIIDMMDYRQNIDGSWPYAFRWADSVVGNTVPYNWVLARDLAEYHALFPSTTTERMLKAAVGFLLQGQPTLPFVNRALADVAGVDMGAPWSIYAGNIARGQQADGSLFKPGCAPGATCDPKLRDDHSACYVVHHFLDHLRWSGYRA